MSKSRKMSKPVVAIVKSVNDALRNLKVKDQYSSDLFIWCDRYLLDHNMYHGFNFYKDKEYNGEVYRVLAGSSNPEEFDYIQFHICDGKCFI